MKKRLLSLRAVLVLFVALLPSLLAQPLPPVLISDSADPNFVVQSTLHAGKYIIAEYYTTNGGPAYTINGLTFTDNPSRLTPGVPGATFGAIYRNGATANFTGADAAALAAISGGDMYCNAGVNIDNIPTTAGHSYLLELLFHDNYYSSTNGVGRRQFNVEIGPQAGPYTLVMDHMDLAGMGAGVYNSVDVLVRYIVNDSDGTPLRVVLGSLGIDAPMISAFAMIDLGPGDLPLVLTQPVSRTSYVGWNASFGPCDVLGSGITSQKWQSDAASPGTYYDLANGTLNDGSTVAGATTKALSLGQLTTAEAGNYQFVATNPNGSTTAGPVTLAVENLPQMSRLTDPAQLNLNGGIYYSEFYGTWNTNMPIRGVNFVWNNARVGGASAFNNLPNFGSGTDAHNLAWISANNQWMLTGNIDFTLPTLPGRNYLLQLVFHDNRYPNPGQRVFDVNVGPQGNLPSPAWAPNIDLALLGACLTNGVDVVLTYGLTNSDGTPLEVQLSHVRDNPMISALVYADVTSGNVAAPLMVTQPTTPNNIFLGHTLRLSATAIGTPLNYQWKAGPNGSDPSTFTNVIDGGNQWGANTATLTITNITMSQQLDYQLIVSNSGGTTNSSVATTTLYPPPVTIANSASYAYYMLTNGPGGVGAVDYWRLNDPNGSPMVYDSGPGAKDGIAVSATLAQPGPAPTEFPGFEADNTSMETYAGFANYAQVPPLNLKTNTVTFLAWVYPAANQNAGAGLLISRQPGSAGPGTGSADFGLGYGVTARSGGDYSLRYFWNGAAIDSGLMVPQYTWSLVGAVVTSSNATLYVANASGLSSWTASSANAVVGFSNPLTIGNDPIDAGAPGTSSRTFSGYIDEVAAFTRPLAPWEITAAWTNATRVSFIPPTATRMLAAPAVVVLNAGGSTNFSCTVGGAPAPSMQWMWRPPGLTGDYANVANGGGFSGAQSATLSLSGATASMNGDYILVVSNHFGQTPELAQSLPVRVLVVQPNQSPALIGHWLTGDQSLADKSQYAGSGVHDGVVVYSSGTYGSPSWVNDTPAAFSGPDVYSLQGDGLSALAITNTATSDSDYRLDYDNNITNRFTVAFWAKGWPSQGNWYPFVSKNVENSGWALRRANHTGNNPAFSIINLTQGTQNYPAAVDIRDGAWHHYAGTYDAVAGIRSLYVDGNLVTRSTRDFPSVTPANLYHLVIAGEDQGGGTPFFRYGTTPIFDVRLYNYALAPAEVQSMLTPTAPHSVGLYFDATYPIPVGQPEAFSVMLPAGANASGPVTVWVTNNSPSVVQFHGTPTNVLWVVFAQNAPTTQSFLLDTIGAGAISLSLGNNGGMGNSPVASVNVVMPGMIGHWLTGAQNLTDSANVDGAGAHDGMLVGTTTTTNWAADVPTGFTGSSLNFSSANYGMAVKGSSKLTGSGETYYPTFDANICEGFSCAFWAKGTPGTWSPWVSKYGDGNAQPGWELRQNNNLGQPSFTLRQSADAADSAETFNSLHSFAYLGTANWHHYVLSYDAQAGLRRVFIDGVLSINVPNDFGPVPVDAYAYLVFGALDSAGPNQNPPAHGYSKYFNGKIFDARMYNYPLNGAEALAVMNANDATSLRAVTDYKTIDLGHTGAISLSLPEGVTAATVTVNNLNPSLVSIVGSPATLTFSSSTPRAKMLTLKGLAEGTATVQFTAPGLTPASVTVKVVGQYLVGRWLAGPEDLKDHSGFTPAGTHDGVAYNAGTVKIPMYDAAPSGFPGRSLSIPTGGSNPYGILISNTAATFGNPQTIDVNYQSTFDDLLANRFTIAFWANATTASGNWSGMVGKLGEGDAGYLVHRNSATTAGDCVIKSTASHVSDLIGSANLYNSTWHHIAAVWDGYTGTRTLYVDGVVDASRSGDYGPMSMAPNHHLTFASEEGDSIGATYLLARNGYMAGNLYDVRIYNYALSQSAINALRTPPVLATVSLTAPLNNASYTAPATIPLSASVTTNGNTITAVNYYQGTTLIGTGSGPTWSATSTSLSAGTYDIYAVMTCSPDGINTLTLNSSSNHVTIANTVVPPIISSCSWDPATGHMIISGQNTGGVTQNSRLVYTDDLSTTPVVWHQFTPDVTSTGTTFSFTITGVTAPAQRFYRVQNY